MSEQKNSKSSLRSSSPSPRSRCSSSIRSPAASRVKVRIFSGSRSPRRSSSARTSSSVSRGTTTSCVRDRIVGSNKSGRSLTSTKSVFSHGSSRIFRILLAASSFIVSGSHTITHLYSAAKLLNASLRMMPSASRAEIAPLSVRPRSRRSYHSCGEK